MNPSALHPPFAHLQTLRTFWLLYPEIENYLWNLYPIPTDEDKHPGLSIDGQDEGSKRWALETFGYGIWHATRTDEDGIYWTISAVIDGVEVNLWRAIRCDECHLSKGAAVPAFFLAVSHPANATANLVPAILAAATGN